MTTTPQSTWLANIHDKSFLTSTGYEGNAQLIAVDTSKEVCSLDQNEQMQPLESATMPGDFEGCTHRVMQVAGWRSVRSAYFSRYTIPTWW